MWLTVKSTTTTTADNPLPVQPPEAAKPSDSEKQNQERAIFSGKRSTHS